MKVRHMPTFKLSGSRTEQNNGHRGGFGCKINGFSKDLDENCAGFLLIENLLDFC